MYLNVNLTPPSSGGEGSSSTPKTPEILNSIMSLTSPPLPQSYSQYQNPVGTNELSSPTSSTASPSEEKPIHLELRGTSNTIGGDITPNIKSCSSYYVVKSAASSGGTVSSTGTPSPPVFELQSPVNTVEATKTALIKEGLKHQIKSKLQAAGIPTLTEVVADTNCVKEENSYDTELTHEDEERRRKRRERNKIAATKCRNKKKEKTTCLMSESEIVESQNMKLKSEIKRLENERKQLEKLLCDPSHKASCRRNCSTNTNSSPPLVIVTPPDGPDESQPCGSSLSIASTSNYQPPLPHCSKSIRLPENLVYCPEGNIALPGSSPTFEGSYMCKASDLPSYPPVPEPSPSLTPPKVLPHSSRDTCSNAYSENTNLVWSSPVDKTSSISSNSIETFSRRRDNNQGLVPKHGHTSIKRYQPYITKSIHYKPTSFDASYLQESQTIDIPVEEERYLPVPNEGDEVKASLYMYPHLSPPSDRSYHLNEDSINNYVGKTKSHSSSRYTPYHRPDRGILPLSDNLHDLSEEYFQQGPCGQDASSPFLTDATHNNQFYPCNF